MLFSNLFPALLVTATCAAANPVPDGTTINALDARNTREVCAPATACTNTPKTIKATYQICFRFTSANRAKVIGKISGVQYYWGAAWYNPKAGYPYDYTIGGGLDNTHSFSKVGKAHEPSTEVELAELNVNPGQHRLFTRYQQIGPYHTFPKDYVSCDHTYPQFNVPAK
ncbi:hypothetical protein LOZ58_005609 [Ophidiomyces ophidiicola]|nr:hypothetical protein LOZ65_002410 [Ophidiomyces ophidiicola]KAI1936844.1 hypothetical protein LOZ66_004351 [Ophidiomyces ophidiicola]KAI1957525.1 hypothetical protein LOZ58_005609 [Ophidiomyces ophidiicola]